MATTSSLKNVISIDCSKKAFNSQIYLLVALSKNNNLVVVEGQFDKDIFSNFFVGRVHLLPCTGRGYIEKIFKKLPLTIVNVIGLADKDYSIDNCSDCRIFFYDHNNIEMMIFSDNNVFDKPTKLSGIEEATADSLIEIRDRVLNIIYPISIFRLSKANVDAKNLLGINDVIDDILSIKNLSNAELASQIIFKINNCSKRNVNQMLKTLFVSNYNNEMSKTHNLYDITQGHDFVDLYCDLASISEKTLRKNILSSYSSVLFKRTSLYSNLRRYEIIQGTQFLL